MTPQELPQSLSDARALFARLKPPSVVEGSWQATFIGPAWLRALAPLGMAVSPLRGWFGKHFGPGREAINLVRRGGQVQAIVPMHMVARASAVDGQPVLATEYAAGAPWLLRDVADEFRVLDANNLLGLMTVKRRGLRWVVFPFLLTRAPHGAL